LEQEAQGHGTTFKVLSIGLAKITPKLHHKEAKRQFIVSIAVLLTCFVKNFKDGLGKLSKRGSIFCSHPVYIFYYFLHDGENEPKVIKRLSAYLN